jgi:hypothetical protein
MAAHGWVRRGVAGNLKSGRLFGAALFVGPLRLADRRQCAYELGRGLRAVKRKNGLRLALLRASFFGLRADAPGASRAADSGYGYAGARRIKSGVWGDSGARNTDAARAIGRPRAIGMRSVTGDQVAGREEHVRRLSLEFVQAQLFNERATLRRDGKVIWAHPQPSH